MGSREERHRHHHDLVPLAALISRELKNEKMEKPTVRYGSAAQSRKGEDYFLMKTDCQRVPGNPSTFFSVLDEQNLSDLRNRGKRERVTASGGEVGRLSIFGGTEVRLVLYVVGQGVYAFPDQSVTWMGEFIVPIPYVKQVKLSSTGGRLIIASDGIWDALSSEMAAKSCRGLPAELAARLVVKEALRTRGLKDDTTCIVVDIIPPDNRVPPPPTPKKYTKLKALLFRKKSYGSANKLSMKLSSVGIVEELFEEGSAMLAERLGNDDTRGQTSSLFVCAVCQADLAPNEGISVHAGSIFSVSSKPWQGPFLCADCRNKKDAMEGKRPSGVRVV
ncbi:UNVERIFIED_CONTAM: putative protein phosphatase 2C 3 [Sesamum calycinum]|uniref:PPM-type phosphatase domain-containing protein n=1 Tax=Sesamum calycinum TaxID=2727403 RepID=A0AAW2JB85_9LAMI